MSRSTRSPASAALLLVALCGARTPDDAEHALRDRVAGPPKACITLTRTSDQSRILDDHALIYDGFGSTVYLNRPENCPALTPWRAVVTRSPGGQLCRGDIINIVDVTTRADFGGCSLGEFVPYSKPKTPKPQ
jgi:hypothetical protein